MNLTNTTLVIAGLILIYCAIKDVNPADVIKNALQGQATESPGGHLKKGTDDGSPLVPPAGTAKVPGKATVTA